jgi:hypothetical protein
MIPVSLEPFTSEGRDFMNGRLSSEWQIEECLWATVSGFICQRPITGMWFERDVPDCHGT